MSKIKLAVIFLLVAAAAQVFLLLSLTLLVYQVTPKSTIAQATFIGRLQPVLLGFRLADRSLNFLYRGPKPSEELPLYRLQIAKEDLSELEEQIAETEVFITDDSKLWLPATFVADGEEFDVKVRIRGDRFNHWKFRKKSWRIKFPKEHLFRGMREMSLIIPEDRGWFAEMLNSERAEKFGLLQPPMRFATVSLNGSKPMLYLEVEHWTKEMLEKQARPGDINFYKTGGVNTSVFDGWDPIFQDIAYWGKYTESVASPFDSFEELALLFSLMKPGAHLQPGFREQVTTLFDLNQMIKWYAHSLLSGNLHVGGDNLRLLFDTSRGRFEPVPWDVFLTSPRPLLTLPGNPLWNEVFAVPEWRVATYAFLWEYINGEGEESVEGDLQEAKRLRSLIESAAYRDPQKLQSNRQIKRDLDERSRQVEENVAFLREELQRSELLITQRIPTASERQKGVGLVLDVIVRGPVPSSLSGMVLPLSLVDEGGVSLYRDNGNGLFDSADAGISFERTTGVTEDILTFAPLSVIVAPLQPEVDPSGEPVSIPHTHHKFFLMGIRPNKQYLPIVIDFRNAATSAPAQVIRTTVVDENRYENSVPLLP